MYNFGFPTPMSSPIKYSLPVTPSDTTVLAPTRAIYVGVAGNLAVTDYQGNSTYVAAQIGWHPLEVTKVLSTGTTATNIRACY